MAGAAEAPFPDIWINVAVLVGGQGAVFEKAAHLQKKIDRCINIMVDWRRERLDGRALSGEKLAGRFHGVAHHGFRFWPEAHVGKYAYLEALEVAAKSLMILGAVGREAPRVSFVLTGQYG